MMDFNVEDFLNENFTEDGSQKKMLDDDDDEEEMSESMISIRKLKTALRNEKVLLFSQREEENLRHIHTQKKINRHHLSCTNTKRNLLRK